MRYGPTIVAALCAGALAFGASGAERTESGQSLIVPENHQSLGTVYHAQPGKDAQVTFTSDAPLEHIKGVSAAVVGYAVAGPEDDPAALRGGEFRLPVASMDTGIPLRNEHMQGERWLNAGSYPDIVFSLAEGVDTSVAREGDGFTTYDVTLVGDMTIKGETKTMRIPARVTIMPASDRTRTRARGDLMAVRCQYEIPLRDFGVSDQNLGMKVAETITIDNALFLSTIRPEDQRR